MSKESPANQPPREAGDDAHLDRMVEPEYAAVSMKAILALILTGLGALALLPKQPYLSIPAISYRLPILIVLPLIALAAAVAALRAIRRSEGTLIGLKAATVATVLSAAFILGSIGQHGYMQYRQKELLRTLREAAQGYLELVMQEKYEPVYQELAANNPLIAERGPTFKRWRSNIHRFMTTLGDYYGRNLQRQDLVRPKDPSEGADLRGVVVHRFRFERGGVDLNFVFKDTDQGWKLMVAEPRPIGVFPKRGDKPKKRYEE
ncbi:MAG: hypothetical protein GWP05_02010 [Anaerolineaceae bacterium]|nr:hypothetical protein [Anaerolineaceae bacterium]